MTAFADNPVLTAAQKRFLESFVASPFARSYRLTGGTALAAFHLRHRVSEDLDFFTLRQASYPDLKSFVEGVPGFARVTHERVLDRLRFVAVPVEGGTLILDFVERPEPALDPPLLVEGLQVETARDILANKLIAMFDRREPKDFVDVFFLLKDKPPEAILDGLADLERKYHVQGARWVLQPQFLAVRRLPELPPTTPPVTAEELASRFQELVGVLVKRAVDQEE